MHLVKLESDYAEEADPLTHPSESERNALIGLLEVLGGVLVLAALLLLGELWLVGFTYGG